MKRPADAENYAPQYTSLMPVAHDPEGAGVGWGGGACAISCKPLVPISTIRLLQCQ
ncbi:hypothetical protein OAM69_01440 [bacterium]|nr:hypothetical protein [bacterium]